MFIRKPLDRLSPMPDTCCISRRRQRWQRPGRAEAADGPFPLLPAEFQIRDQGGVEIELASKVAGMYGESIRALVAEGCAALGVEQVVPAGGLEGKFTGGGENEDGEMEGGHGRRGRRGRKTRARTG